MTEPIKIGNETQLFIDDYCIGELCGVSRSFHKAEKHPASPLMLPQGFEKDIQLYGNVLHDPEMGLYRMWYNVRYDLSSPTGFAICHATSDDGISWERTELNRLKDDKGNSLPNALLTGYLRGPTVFFTPDDPDSGRRYRMFVHTGRYIVGDDTRKPPFTAAYSVLFSADGYDWKPYENNPVVQGGDIATCMYDPLTKEYIAFPKVHRSDMGLCKRCVGVCISKDFMTWQNTDMILSADAIDDSRVPARLNRFRDVIIYDDPEYYSADMQGMTGFRYKGIRLGLIWFYDRSGRRPDDLGGNDDGVVNIQLAYSRDIDPYLGWKRAGDRYDFIPCGPPGEYDCGMIFTAHTVVEHEDELRFYYTGYNISHGGSGGEEPSSSLNLATLRRDGFASIDADTSPGYITTKLLKPEGEKLIINADAANGHILVELTDEESKAIAGYTKDDCIPFGRDEIRGEVHWKNQKDRATVNGKAVHIKFYIKSAKLFSFRWC